MKVTQVLAVLIVIFVSGCATTYTEIDWKTQTKYERVAVISTLGEEISIVNQRFMVGDNILETKTLPPEAIVKPIEELVISHLQQRGLRAESVSQQMQGFDFINNLFPGEPMLRTRKIREKLGPLGYDMAIVILPSTFLSGDHNTYLYNEMGVYRWHIFSKPKEQAFVNFFLHTLDLVGDDELRGGGGLVREPSQVAVEPFIKEGTPLSAADWASIESQVREMALARIQEILDEQ